MCTEEKDSVQISRINFIFAAVRTLCYILSIMVLVLGFVPCTDIHIDHNKERFEISNGQSSSSHLSGDACSPFCQCSCCTSPTLIHLNAFTIEPPERLEEFYGEHLPGQIIETLFSVWQPPRLS